LDGVTDIPTVPPLAPRREHRWVRPTGTVEDPWAWLRDKEDPETIAYLEAENTWSDRWFAARTGTVEELYEEIRSRIDEDDVSWPVHHRGWWYTSRTETGKNYAIHTRGRTVDTAGEDLLLDEAEAEVVHALALLDQRAGDDVDGGSRSLRAAVSLDPALRTEASRYLVELGDNALAMSAQNRRSGK
jgi:protease II